MSALLPAMVYGLEIPPGDVMVPAAADFPAAFRITMAAIDPSASPEFSGTTAPDASPRATLKIIRQMLGPEDDEDDEDYDSDDEDQLLLGAGSDDDEEDEEDSDEDEKNGGPSDPTKSKKAQRAAAAEALREALANGEDDDDDEMSVEDGLGLKINKGKAKATDSDEEDDEDDEDLGIEEFVICTLDPVKMYQQPLDITIGEDEQVFFKVSGTHTIYLTGNFVMPVDDSHNHMIEDGEEDEYDLSPDEDELDLEEDESDELDDMDDPRLVEIESEEEEVPKLVKKAKGKNKRPAEESDEEAGLDEIMTKSLKKESAAATNGEVKLSKKQMKKLKNNAGEAVAAALENKNVKKVESSSSTVTESPSTKEKKVQFAKNLEQGPTGKDAKALKDSKVNGDKGAKKVDEVKPKADKTESTKGKSTIGVKTVQGVTVDDRKLGTGPAAKKGNKVGMRYIGKTDDGKQFDANKKGKPFQFTLGAGEVIKGWDIGVEGMAVGGERRLIIPANLAYGNKAIPGIPKNSRLTFDVKLVEIK